MKKRIVITGMGAVAPNGIGKKAFWEALISGKSGIKEISRFDASSYPCHIAGEVDNFDPCDYMDGKLLKRTGRFVHLGLASAVMASNDAQLDSVKARDEIGVIVGTSVNALDVIENGIIILSEKGFKRLSPFSLVGSLPHVATGAISVALDIKGFGLTVSTGCSSAINAIGIGSQMIRSGVSKTVICVGSDAPITPMALAGFCASGILAQNNYPPEKASRPFDSKRSGGVLSEGAAAVVLEDLTHALDRNAVIYAEVIGFGSTSEAYSINGLQPDGKEFARTMRLALADGRLSPSEIDYVCAHAPSDPVGDAVECQAIKEVFGPELSYRIPISSIKSMIGNPLAAAGVLQVLASVLAVNEGIIPPTINYEYSDPQCDLDHVPNTPKKKDISTVLINSHGLGASDTTLIIREYIEQSQ